MDVWMYQSRMMLPMTNSVMHIYIKPTHVYTKTVRCIHVCMCVCVYVCVYVCMCVCVCEISEYGDDIHEKFGPAHLHKTDACIH